MQQLLTGAHIVDAILVLVVLEGAVLAAVWRWAGRGLPPEQFLPTLAAGACLLLALRSALTQAWPWVAMWLAAALLSHVVDLSLRWRG
jgi:hypothetical protein